jgi:prepilin-type N-terminal cleavage/methylation domain-containing protein
MSNNRAFTMMELIFVVIVIGILASVIIPRSQSSRLREAADQIVSHIRYTQHLAMMDDKFDPSNNEWFKGRWQIRFMHDASIDGDETQYWGYVVFSDTPMYGGEPEAREIARNPLDASKLLIGGASSVVTRIEYEDARTTKELNIGKKYGITNVIFNNNCSNSGSTRLAFDYLGRPLKGNIANSNSPYDTTRLMFERCTITFTNSAGENINITIEPETGFAQVVSS